MNASEEKLGGLYDRVEIDDVPALCSIDNFWNVVWKVLGSIAPEAVSRCKHLTVEESRDAKLTDQLSVLQEVTYAMGQACYDIACGYGIPFDRHFGDIMTGLNLIDERIGHWDALRSGFLNAFREQLFAGGDREAWSARSGIRADIADILDQLEAIYASCDFDPQDVASVQVELHDSAAEVVVDEVCSLEFPMVRADVVGAGALVPYGQIAEVPSMNFPRIGPVSVAEFHQRLNEFCSDWLSGNRFSRLRLCIFFRGLKSGFRELFFRYRNTEFDADTSPRGCDLTDSMDRISADLLISHITDYVLALRASEGLTPSEDFGCEVTLRFLGQFSAEVSGECVAQVG